VESTVEERYTHPAVGADLLAALAAGAPSGQRIPEITPAVLRAIGSMPMRKVADMLAGAIPASAFDRQMGRSRSTPAARRHGEEA
jgi:beta-glucosidase